MLPRALLLDLDGTLIDSEPFHAESIARFLASQGLELDGDERDFVIGHAWQDIHVQLRVQERLGMDLDTLRAGAIAVKPAILADGFKMTVLPGAVELVQLAEELGIPACIVSGSSRLEIAQALEQLPVGRLLQFTMGAEDYPRGKPAPDGYRMAAERLAVPPSACLVVEDSAAGIASGLAAGMRVLATRAATPGPGEPGHQDQGAAHRVVDGLEVIDEALLRAVMVPQ